MSVAPDAAHDAGQFFLTLQIAAKLNLPAVEPMKQQVNDRLPQSLRNDANADWQHWPMRIKPQRIVSPRPGDDLFQAVTNARATDSQRLYRVRVASD